MQTSIHAWLSRICWAPDAARAGAPYEAHWRAQYECSPELQAEFSSPEMYVAYQRGVARGAARVIGGQVTAIPRWMKLGEVVETTGLSAATIYRRMADGSFPKQFHIGGAARWDSREVLATMDRLRAEREAGDPDEATLGAWRSTYEESSTLQAEFGSVDNYLAFKRAQHAGRAA